MNAKSLRAKFWVCSHRCQAIRKPTAGPFHWAQDHCTASLKGPGTPGSTYRAPTPSLRLNACDCYVSTSVCVKFSCSFSCIQDRTCNSSDRHTKQMTTKQTAYRMRVSRDMMRPGTCSFQCKWGPPLKSLNASFLLLGRAQGRTKRGSLQKV